MMSRNYPYRIAMAFSLIGMLIGCCNRDADKKVLDEQQDFVCGVNNEVAYEAWSECGLMKVCINPRTSEKDGSQFASQGGHLQSKSHYSEGNRLDGWTWYDKDGNANHEAGGYSR